MMLAFYSDKVLEAWLDVIKGAAQAHGAARVNFWLGYACCIHADNHLFVHSYTDLFIALVIKHLRVFVLRLC